MGRPLYDQTSEILITADGGCSNSSRPADIAGWKVELQKLADEINRTIHVCHFPPGTSKWNKIKHKMFCFITKNWRGKPILSRQTVVQLIANTTTKAGLKIEAVIDENNYETGIKVADPELEKVKLTNTINLSHTAHRNRLPSQKVPCQPVCRLSITIVSTRPNHFG
jgi:hypothetical protein